MKSLVIGFLGLLCGKKSIKKKKIKWEIEERKVTNVNPKYCKDVMWLVWQTILTEANERDENTKLQISSLYNLYKESYAPGKKTLRIPLLYHALGYLTHHVKFNIPIRKNDELFLQTQCNVNFMFRTVKHLNLYSIYLIIDKILFQKETI